MAEAGRGLSPAPAPACVAGLPVEAPADHGLPEVDGAEELRSSGLVWP